MATARPARARSSSVPRSVTRHEVFPLARRAAGLPRSCSRSGTRPRGGPRLSGNSPARLDRRADRVTSDGKRHQQLVGAQLVTDETGVARPACLLVLLRDHQVELAGAQGPGGPSPPPDRRARRRAAGAPERAARRRARAAPVPPSGRPPPGRCRTAVPRSRGLGSLQPLQHLAPVAGKRPPGVGQHHAAADGLSSVRPVSASSLASCWEMAEGV